MDPLEIFPSEIWEEVFDRIEEAEDWVNLYWAAPSFRSVVGSQRHEALFPQVLPQLTKYLISSDTMDLVELLPLRLVSHKWRQGVDKLIERVSAVSPLANYEFKSTPKISSFLRKFGNHPTSPFVGRSIGLTQYNSQHHHNLLMRLMRQFGAGLKGLIISNFSSYDLQRGSSLVRFRDMLQLAPELERLEIQGHSRNLLCRLAAERLFAQTEVQFTPANPAILPNLKAMTIKAYDDSMERQDLQAWHDVLLRLCCNRESLTEVTLELLPNELPTFTKLKSVSLSGITREELLRFGMETKWPLSDLSLGWPFRDLALDMQTVFRAVERFGDTLSSLSFDIGFQTPRNFWEEPLVLPQLKSLRITGVQNSFSSLDFLVSLSRLEVLHVEGWTERLWEARKEERIRAPTIIDGAIKKINMLKSNIWEVLPRLRKFNFVGGILKLPTSYHERFRHAYSRDYGNGVKFVSRDYD